MIRNGEYRPVLPIKGQVEVIAGNHTGKHGYISDITKGMVQIKSGVDDIFAVRKTSVQLLAHPVVFAGEAEPKGIDLPQIIHHITLVGDVLNDAEGTGSNITLQQWVNIHQMICQMFK